MLSRPLRVPGERGGPITWPLVAAGAASQAIFALGWNNHFVSDDWFYLHAVSKVHVVAQLWPLLSFDTEWFVRPVQWLLTYALYATFGLTPAPYHIASQALDVANAGLLGLLVVQLLWLLGQRDFSVRLPLGLLVSVLFLYSWRHHEAVYWYASANELLAAGFRLSVLNVLAWWLRARRRYAVVFAASTVGTALALLSKESAVTLPFESLLVLALARAPSPRPAAGPRPGLLLVAGQLVVAGLWAWAYLETSPTTDRGLERAGAVIVAAAPLEWAQRFVQFFNGNYVGASALARPPVLLLLELGALLGLLAAALRRGQPLWAFSIAWTFLAVAPYVATTHARLADVKALLLVVRGDRFLYYSAAGASLLLVSSFLWLAAELRRLGWDRRWRRLGVGVSGGLLTLSLIANAEKLVRAEADWDGAGRIVRSVLTRLERQLPAPRAGDLVCLIGLPLTHNGKYVFASAAEPSIFATYRRDDFAVRVVRHQAGPGTLSACAVSLAYAGVERDLLRVE